MEFLLLFFLSNYINSLDNILLCKRSFLNDYLVSQEQYVQNYSNPKIIYFVIDDELKNFKSIDLKRSKYSEQKDFYKVILESMDMKDIKISFNNKNLNINNNIFIRESIKNDTYTENLVKIGVRLDMHKMTKLLFMYSDTETIKGRTILKNPPTNDVKNLTLEEVQSLIKPKHEEFISGLTYIFDRNTFELNFYKNSNPDNASLVEASYDCNLVKRNIKNQM